MKKDDPLTPFFFLKNIFNYDFFLVPLVHKYFVRMFPLRNRISSRYQNILDMSPNWVQF